MPAVGQQVALPPRYRVVRHIANGGMASVWAAEDSLLERLVAVKVLAPGFAADDTARRRFTREARAAARVSDHPHVVTIFDIGEDGDGQAFIVMEHLAGGTLADRLRRGEPIPTPTALAWLRQAASALDAAHAADIVHRDVKPGNLLLDENGRLAVGDFGIASLAGETAVTQAGQVLGTAAYLSPEQARGNPATPASDRYSLAVVAYELLCGRRPFGGDTPVAQARAHAEVDPPTPVGPCEAAAAALKHGLAKDPAARPPTATAFVEELERALGDAAEPTRVTAVAPPRRDEPRFTRPGRAAAAAVPVGAADPRPATPLPPEPVSRRGAVHDRPNRGTWALVGLVMVCILGGVVAALLGNGDASKPKSSASRHPATAAKHHTATAKKRSSPKTTSTPAASTPATTPSTPATAATSGMSPGQLNDAGFAKLQAGDARGALPLLQQAVQGFRDQGDRSSVTYAYALFNLASALRQTGDPAAAIPLLQERLSFSNDRRGLVQQELRRDQQLAGQAPSGDGKQGKKSKKAKD